MILTRCSDQPHATLEEFYSVVNEDPLPEAKQAMLDLVSRLRALPGKQRVWGLTSIGRLCLLAQDTYKSPWFVIIGALDKNEYHVEYLMPDHIAPWPGAYVKGEARSTDQAVKMIITAMQNSEGWNES